MKNAVAPKEPHKLSDQSRVEKKDNAEKQGVQAHFLNTQKA